jgi:ribosomal protein L37AE/L43A
MGVAAAYGKWQRLDRDPCKRGAVARRAAHVCAECARTRPRLLARGILHATPAPRADAHFGQRPASRTMIFLAE